MNVYLAGTYSRDYVVKLYLAGEHEVKNGSIAKQYNNAPHILESYYYARTNKWLMDLVPRFKSFLLDSGAFTFMSDPKNKAPWDEYVEQYAKFINRYGIASQLIDTAIFITIAFIGVVPDLWWMVVSQYFVKLIIAAVDTPVFYLLTRESKNSE